MSEAVISVDLASAVVDLVDMDLDLDRVSDDNFVFMETSAAGQITRLILGLLQSQMVTWKEEAKEKPMSCKEVRNEKLSDALKNNGRSFHSMSGRSLASTRRGGTSSSLATPTSALFFYQPACWSLRT
jgi:hypothetical protein